MRMAKLLKKYSVHFPSRLHHHQLKYDFWLTCVIFVYSSIQLLAFAKITMCIKKLTIYYKITYFHGLEDQFCALVLF